MPSLEAARRQLGQLMVRQVPRTDEESLLNGLVEMHHYLGYTQPVGEHLKHLVYAGDRPVACFTWSSTPRHLGPLDIEDRHKLEARHAVPVKDVLLYPLKPPSRREFCPR